MRKHSGQGIKLLKKTTSTGKEAFKPTRSLNQFIEQSDLDVFTRKNSRGGKFLAFRETVDTWVEDSKSECKEASDEVACQIEYLQENQPEYCLMGNPRSCIKKSTIKTIERLRKERDKELDRKYKQEKEDYLSGFDNLTNEEILELEKTDLAESRFSEYGTEIYISSSDYFKLSNQDRKSLSDEVFANDDDDAPF